jgi:hypothetical protein
MPGKMARSGPQRHLDGPGGPEGAVHTPIRASKQSGNRYNARRFGVHLGNTGSIVVMLGLDRLLAPGLPNTMTSKTRP